MSSPPSTSPAADAAPATAGVAAAPEAVPQTMPASSSAVRAWGLALAAGAGVVALLLAVVLWNRIASMQEVLARQNAQAQADALQARTLAKDAVSLSQDALARLSVQEARLSEVALQRAQLDDLMQSLSRSRDENLVVDIEAALRLAVQQAQLTGSVEPLLAALKTAEQRVVRAAQPRLGLLQRALARDIDRVQAATVSDTAAMLVRLDEVVRLIDELPLANAVDKSARTVSAQPAAHNLLQGWRDVAASWWQEIRGLVRVSRIDDPEAALVAPEQAFFLRENLKLRVLNARLGLLARQFEAAQADLSWAQSNLRKYFLASARSTQSAQQLLAQLQQQMRAVHIPRIDDTLTVLATVAAGR